jgi:hypothetical protein
MSYTIREREKFNRRVMKRRDRIAKKEMKTYQRDTDINKVRLPKAWRMPFMAACILYMVIGVYFTIYLLISGIIVDLSTYLILVIFFVIAPVLMLMYPQAHNADERTLQVQFGDLPPMPADTLVPGKNTITRSYKFTNPKEPTKTQEEDKRTFEPLRMGDLSGAWPKTPREIIGLGVNQFCNGDSGGKPIQSGYMVGNVYHVPPRHRC